MSSFCPVRSWSPGRASRSLPFALRNPKRLQSLRSLQCLLPLANALVLGNAFAAAIFDAHGYQLV
jgi:hypothetical protein